MGRSVSRPHNATTVIFRTLEVEPPEVDEDVDSLDEKPVWEPTADDFAFEFEHLEDWVREFCKEHWPSFQDCDKWLGREDHAILENNMAWIGLSEYCGLVALWIVPKTDEHAWDGTGNLCAPWCNQIAPAFVKQFGEYRQIGSMSNGEGVYRRMNV